MLFYVVWGLVQATFLSLKLPTIGTTTLVTPVSIYVLLILNYSTMAVTTAFEEFLYPSQIETAQVFWAPAILTSQLLICCVNRALEKLYICSNDIQGHYSLSHHCCWMVVWLTIWPWIPNSLLFHCILCVAYFSVGSRVTHSKASGLAYLLCSWQQKK